MSRKKTKKKNITDLQQFWIPILKKDQYYLHCHLICSYWIYETWYEPATKWGHPSTLLVQVLWEKQKQDCTIMETFAERCVLDQTEMMSTHTTYTGSIYIYNISNFVANFGELIIWKREDYKQLNKQVCMVKRYISKILFLQEINKFSKRESVWLW